MESTIQTKFDVIDDTGKAIFNLQLVCDNCLRPMVIHDNYKQGNQNICYWCCQYLKLHGKLPNHT